MISLCTIKKKKFKKNSTDNIMLLIQHYGDTRDFNFVCDTVQIGNCVIFLPNLHPLPPTIWVSSPGITHRIVRLCRRQTSQCALF